MRASKRTTQAINFVANHPGATPSEISKGIKLKSSGYIYPMLNRLVEAGKLVKEGKGYAVASGTEQPKAKAEPKVKKVDNRLLPIPFETVESMNYHMGNAVELICMANTCPAEVKRQYLEIAAHHLLRELDRA